MKIKLNSRFVVQIDTMGLLKAFLIEAWIKSCGYNPVKVASSAVTAKERGVLMMFVGSVMAFSSIAVITALIPHFLYKDHVPVGISLLILSLIVVVAGFFIAREAFSKDRFAFDLDRVRDKLGITWGRLFAMTPSEMLTEVNKRLEAPIKAVLIAWAHYGITSDSAVKAQAELLVLVDIFKKFGLVSDITLNDNFKTMREYCEKHGLIPKPEEGVSSSAQATG